MDKLTIGRVSAKTGCNIETIRYYEHEGLMPAPPRSLGGHRLYNPVHIERLIFIRRARELGFTMAEVKQLLAIVDKDEVACDRVEEIARKHLADIRSKIADLRKMQKILNDLASQCAGSDVPECPIIDALQQDTRRLL